MNRRIPTRLAIEFVLLAALITYGLTWIMNDSISSQVVAFMPIKKAKAVSDKNKDKCQVKAYQGKATIRVWFANPEDENIVTVHMEDLSKLPKTGGDAKIRLVDIDSSLKKGLDNASAKKPKEITIEGYAVSCDGVDLASVSYEDGIFRPYLSLK